MGIRCGCAQKLSYILRDAFYYKICSVEFNPNTFGSPKYTKLFFTKEMDLKMITFCFIIFCLFVAPRRIYSNDGSFSLEEKNWLFCHSDLPALYHDCDSLSSVILAEQRICTCQDSFWWVYWAVLALFVTDEAVRKHFWSMLGKGLFHPNWCACRMWYSF